MHGPMNFKSPNNISKWQMGFNSAFKGLMHTTAYCTEQFKKLYGRNCKKNKRMINWEENGYRRSLSTSNCYRSLYGQTEKPHDKSQSI